MAAFCGLFPAVTLADDNEAECRHKSHAALDDARSCWEFGLFFFTGSLPVYEGSADRKYLNLLLPYFLYEGPVLKLKKSEAAINWFKTETLSLSLSGYLSPSVKSEESAKRENLSDLKAVVEAGPSLKWYFAGKAYKNWVIELPLRYAFTLESSPQLLDYVFNPKLSYKLVLDQAESMATSTSVDFSLGMKVVGADYANFYYGISEDVLSPFGSYQAKGGYAGSYLSAGWSRKQKVWSFGAYSRVTLLEKAAFIDSPLLENKASWLLGAFVSRDLWVSN